MPGWFGDNTLWPCGRFWCIFGTLEVPHRLDYFAGTERYWAEGSVVCQEFQVDCMKMVTVGKFEGGARKIGRKLEAIKLGQLNLSEIELFRCVDDLQDDIHD
ncbi:hypothetical protein TIFTF001_040821 [Ficus carica]|uniref:Uncharacterized protein n=1 Tax=Ficus carica TaxID=3494 RepID=A0AA88CQP3_FICCA|nr:hypothetical protein TIFTF001_040816 [Ficus carica]GMN26216.1 hypothetical protein TIFTF001_040821 [Ficus carica]